MTDEQIVLLKEARIELKVSTRRVAEVLRRAKNAIDAIDEALKENDE